MQTMINGGNTPENATTSIRTGCSDVPQGSEQVHALVALVTDRPGAVDRVVGVLRRRRAQLQSFNLSQTETPDVVRITALVRDTKVGIDHLFEQVRKIIDVREASHAPVQDTFLREMALVNVSTISASAETILATAQQLGARAIETTSEAVTLEVTDTEEQVSAFIEAMRIYGICDVARSGCVALVR